MVVLFWLDLWEIFFLVTPGIEPRTSGSLVLHSTTVPRQLLVFTSDNFRYLTLVQRDWWWYCSDWTCERFSFWNTGVWTLDPWISSPVLYLCATGNFWFLPLNNSRYLSMEQRELVVVLFWLDLWEIFFLATLGFEPLDLWISSPALYHYATVNFWF